MIETFIVGTGRCGSTLLSQVLATHPCVLSLSEYFTVFGGGSALRWGQLDGRSFRRQLMTPNADLLAFMEYRVEIPELIGSCRRDASPLLAIPLCRLVDDPPALLEQVSTYARSVPMADAAVQHGRLFSWLARRLNKTMWVERSGGSAEYVSELVDGWPTAKFIHIARRGPECAASMSRHPFFRVKLARILARAPELAVDACLRRNLPFERFAALWSADMMRTERVLGRVPAERRTTVRYEDLLHTPATVLARLLAFIQPNADHRAWAEDAAKLVGQATRPAHTAAMALAFRPGMRVYDRMRAFT